jgi:serine/threonine protein kinase
MKEVRVCAECGATLPSGVPGVFCPACALRGALDGGKQPKEGTLARLFRQLIAPKKADKGHEKPLDSGENEFRQSLPMATVAPAPGEVIGDYEIVEQIGGNMGLVFRARHRLLHKVVALKLVPADWIADPARQTRFQREMRVMGQLEHPNLVPAADARSVGEWHLVAMELIDGVDLQQLVRTQGPLSIAAACEVARQAALGLQYAHEHGLIHRDIKPSNLMLTRTGILKVIDMGLALTRDDSTAQLTQTGLILGTMSYCAPEQFRDASHVDIRADIYSLGCTLYLLLTGKSPYWQRKTFAELMQAHLHEPFPSLAEALPDAPAGLEAVLARMTAKDREARFSTPREVVEALEPFARGADLAPLVPASVPQSPRRRAAERKVPSTPERQRAASQGERAKARWPRVTALLALLLAITGVAFLVMNRPTRDPVVFLMDTTAPGGVYDADNRVVGESNAKEVYIYLAGEHIVPASSLYREPLSADWNREGYVISKRPHLVVIHRSSFHHSYNAKLSYSPTNDYEKWKFLYEHVGDERLIALLGNIGNEVPRTKFLVYSRGTDTNWLRDDFRPQWVEKVQGRFPKLTGRIYTMVIPNGKEGSFRQTETRELLRSNVMTILSLPKKNK